jgi:ADP-heptose:LPS heptosyltransferase
MSKILIFRPDNIGDVVLFTGALKHLRKKFPDAYITLAVLEHAVNLVEVCPYVDKCISLKELNWWYWIERKHIPFAAYFKENIRGLIKNRNKSTPPYDILIYPVKSPLVNHLEIACDLSIPVSYGIVGCRLNVPKDRYPEETSPERLFSMYLDVSKNEPWQHEFFTTLDFLKFMGCDVSDIDDVKPEIWVSKADKNLLVKEQAKDRKIIGLFPGASFKEKCWDPENYGTLARIMGDNLTYVLFGASDDARIAHQVGSFLKSGCPGIRVINLVGKTTLRELYKTISSCNLFIGMDTSGLHLAITAGIPTIGIIGGGHYGRFFPWGEPGRHLFITRKRECFNCNWNCIKDRFECIQNVLPEEVAGKARLLLRS